MLIWNVLRGQLKYEVGMLSALYCLANLGKLIARSHLSIKSTLILQALYEL